MKSVCKFAALAIAAIFSDASNACSCGRPIDPDFWVNRSAQIIIAVPTSAEVVGLEHGRGRIYASLKLLDVLKGPTPNVLPTMVGAVDPEGASCEAAFMLGVAYVLYLDEVDQAEYFVSTCHPLRDFRSLRVSQEELCFEGHPRKETHCSQLLLDLLRNADVANTRYGFGDNWLERHWTWLTERIRILRENAEIRARINDRGNDR